MTMIQKYEKGEIYMPKSSKGSPDATVTKRKAVEMKKCVTRKGSKAPWSTSLVPYQLGLQTAGPQDHRTAGPQDRRMRPAEYRKRERIERIMKAEDAQRAWSYACRLFIRGRYYEEIKREVNRRAVSADSWSKAKSLFEESIAKAPLEGDLGKHVDALRSEETQRSLFQHLYVTHVRGVRCSGSQGYSPVDALEEDVRICLKDWGDIWERGMLQVFAPPIILVGGDPDSKVSEAIELAKAAYIDLKALDRAF